MYLMVITHCCSDREKRMEEKVIMIENSNSSHPINQERYSIIHPMQFYNSFELLNS
jgi:hypothetical protein